MLNLLFTSVLELSLSTGLVVAVFPALSPRFGEALRPPRRRPPSSTPLFSA